MSYTNVTIPTLEEIGNARARAIDAVEVKFWRERHDALLDVLRNIPVAVMAHGYVDICEGSQNIRLVASRENEPD